MRNYKSLGQFITILVKLGKNQVKLMMLVSLAILLDEEVMCTMCSSQHSAAASLLVIR